MTAGRKRLTAGGDAAEWAPPRRAERQEIHTYEGIGGLPAYCNRTGGNPWRPLAFPT
jgi:hypothetical protein